MSRPSQFAASFALAAFVALATSCGPDFPEGDISMATPYVQASDMASINEAYAFPEMGNAPWGFAHNGIDFFPSGDMKPIQAVASGVVERIEFYQDETSINWQVNLTVRFNEDFAVLYVFEPASSLQGDGEVQRANVLVTEDQKVKQGQQLASLRAAGAVAHLHFSLIKGGDWACPAPYFNSEARESILSLVRSDHPTWELCY